MKLQQGILHITATDVSAAFSCNTRVVLDLAVARGEMPAPTWFSPVSAVLAERGLAHEQRYIDALRRDHGRVTDLRDYQGRAAEEATLQAMARGDQVIAQGALRDGAWNGRPDVLRRVERATRERAWSYEPIDAKLTADTRAATVLQLVFYIALLEAQCGLRPEAFYVVVPDGTGTGFIEQRLRTDEYHAIFQRVRGQLTATTSIASEALIDAHYPEPVEHCDVCRHWQGCDARRRTDDHLSLVANITRMQRHELVRQGIHTLEQLGSAPLAADFAPKRGARDGYDRSQHQAHVQLRSRESGLPEFDLLEVEAEHGLCALPAPSEGDLFLDIEGYRFSALGPREYLFGVAYEEEGAADYREYWAADALEERRAFEALIDFIHERLARYPDMHVYHYNHYEPSALKRLMGRYATREDALDELLRGQRFVDLLRVTRQAVRAGVERYSIKDLEVFYGFERTIDLHVVRPQIRAVEHALDLECLREVEQEVRDGVERYNRDDCVSALRLRDWLEELRTHAEREVGRALERPAAASGAASESVAQKRTEAQAVSERLKGGTPEFAAERTPEQHARWLLADLLEYYRREEKVSWWEYFRLCSLEPEELLEEKSALSGLQFEGVAEKSKTGLPVERYSFPPQEFELKVKQTLKLQDDSPFGTIRALDREALTIDIQRPRERDDALPNVLVLQDIVRGESLPKSLLELGRWIADNGIEGAGLHRAARDLLLRRPPQLLAGDLASLQGDPLARAQQAVPLLDHSVLPIQGPPGAGKTHAASRLICDLLAAGKRVGVSAPSHKVIHKLLSDAIACCRDAGVPVEAIAKVSDASEEARPFTEIKDNRKAFKAVTGGTCNLAGGTAFFWAAEELAGSVDVLFVDEAGQMALANVLALARAAKSLVLIGDPQQLEQPVKGSHPEGVDVSALHHVLGERETIPDDAGIFLAETWRLPPEIAAFTSTLFYERRLRARSGCEHQQLRGTRELDGAGLWYYPCPHTGNQSYSEEEAVAIEHLVERLLTPTATWTDRAGVQHALRGEDILVVVPCNAQIHRILARVGARGVRVGTVDKFQGQEAPVVIYGLTSSSPADAPRGLEFLYSGNRLNVATSRAKCACILVASPALFEPECKTVRHLKLANAFCAYLELARDARSGPGCQPRRIDCDLAENHV